MSRTASGEEIRTAFKRLAMEFHPDRNPGNPAAEDRFKEVAEAYDVLSDAEKRARYDHFGHGQQGFDPFAGFGGAATINDIFGEIFGEVFGAHRRGQRRSRGADLRYNLELDLEQAAFGATSRIEIQRPKRCETCHGSGAKPGTHPRQCTTCGGTGEIRRPAGLLRHVPHLRPVPRRGEGHHRPLPRLRRGRRRGREVAVDVQVPPGVDSGTRLKLRGEGELAPSPSGEPGDLYVVIEVRDHPIFQRQDTEVVCDLPVSIAQAALGTSVDVPTLDGAHKLKIPAGTQPGKTFRLKGKGIAPLGGGSRGDQHVRRSRWRSPPSSPRSSGSCSRSSPPCRERRPTRRPAGSGARCPRSSASSRTPVSMRLSLPAALAVILADGLRHDPIRPARRPPPGGLAPAPVATAPSAAAASELSRLRAAPASTPPARSAEAFEKLARAFPTSAEAPEALDEAARAWMRAKQPARAAAAWAELLSRYPLSPRADEARIRYGLAEVEAGRPARACRHCSRPGSETPPAAAGQPGAPHRRRGRGRGELAALRPAGAPRRFPTFRPPSSERETARVLDIVATRLSPQEVEALAAEVPKDGAVGVALAARAAAKTAGRRRRDRRGGARSPASSRPGARPSSRAWRWPSRRAARSGWSRRTRAGSPTAPPRRSPSSPPRGPWPSWAASPTPRPSGPPPRPSRQGVPLLSLSKVEGVAEGRPYVFRLMLTARAQAQALADLAVQRRGLRAGGGPLPGDPLRHRAPGRPSASRSRPGAARCRAPSATRGTGPTLHPW